jgi:hypothetical protein
MRSSTHGRRILAAPGAQPSTSTRSTIWSICAPASSSMTKARRRIDRRKWTPTRTMIDRLELRLQLKPHRLVGDTAYGTASLLGWMVEKKAIEPHVPVWDKSQRQDATFSSSEFQWRPQPMNTVVQGHALRGASRFKGPHYPVTKDSTIIYRSNPTDCSKRALKNRCCPNTPARRIQRSVHEAARDVARRIAMTREYQQSRRERKKVEVLFAKLKRVLKPDRLRQRGLSGAQDEFLIASARPR